MVESKALYRRPSVSLTEIVTFNIQAPGAVGIACLKPWLDNCKVWLERRQYRYLLNVTCGPRGTHRFQAIYLTLQFGGTVVVKSPSRTLQP